jgi:prevent-host-death family protein
LAEHVTEATNVPTGQSQRARATNSSRFRLAKWLSDGYIRFMSTHSIAKAKNQLSELINRALKGEAVVITRHGHPVVELKPVLETVRAVSAVDLDWLAQHRIAKRSGTKNAGELVSTMRDEDQR